MDAVVVLDAITDRVASVELPDGSFTDLPASWLPKGSKESDLIAVQVVHAAGVATITMRVDAEATRARLDEMRQLRDQIPRAKDGDVSL